MTLPHTPKAQVSRERKLTPQEIEKAVKTASLYADNVDPDWAMPLLARALLHYHALISRAVEERELLDKVDWEVFQRIRPMFHETKFEVVDNADEAKEYPNLTSAVAAALRIEEQSK